MEEGIDREQAIRLKNKVHLLTFFITKCEEHEPLEEDENEWHPDFEEAVKSILYLNEHGYLQEQELHEFNDNFNKWLKRFKDLGLADRPVEEWEEGLEDEIYELLEQNYDKVK